jgi:branched-chain amino acid transport system ATP-binding protein
VLDFGKVIASGTPDEVMNNEHVKRAYLGEDDEFLAELDEEEPREAVNA